MRPLSKLSCLKSGVRTSRKFPVDVSSLGVIGAKRHPHGLNMQPFQANSMFVFFPRVV